MSSFRPSSDSFLTVATTVPMTRASCISSTDPYSLRKKRLRCPGMLPPSLSQPLNSQLSTFNFQPSTLPQVATSGEVGAIYLHGVHRAVGIREDRRPNYRVDHVHTIHEPTTDGELAIPF